jgi:hypothetical protein
MVLIMTNCSCLGVGFHNVEEEDVVENDVEEEDVVENDVEKEKKAL